MKPNLHFKKAYDTLVKEQSGKPRSRPVEVTALPLPSIKRLVAVFQPRTLEGNLAEDDQFINELVAALKMRGTRPLDPITVWWSGASFYVIDGHHRLQAYKRCGDTWQFTNPIPVTEFKGTLSEAIEMSIGANSKNRLPMRKVDRLNSAWKLTCLGEHSKARISELTTISPRTIATMRKKLKEIVGNEPEGDPLDIDEITRRPDVHDLAGMTWMQAQMSLRSGCDFDEVKDWDAETQKHAEMFKKRLLRTFGNQISLKPEAFALAIAAINDSLPKRLMDTDAWSDYHDERDHELADDDLDEADELTSEAVDF